MLADFADTSARTGSLGKEVHLPATSRYALLQFIASELPLWRDHPERLPETSEAGLTDQLCSYLASAAHLSSGWDFLQFRTEVADEQKKGRKIDLAPKPCGATVWIEGRRHTQFDTLLPIECKRLPTPKDKDRDEREYVFTSPPHTTGGVQRFKDGNHGGAHTLAGMIGYVQEGTAETWQVQIAAWVKDLVAAGQPDWSLEDSLHLVKTDKDVRITELRSSHSRAGKPVIELRHLWVIMN